MRTTDVLVENDHPVWELRSYGRGLYGASDASVRSEHRCAGKANSLSNSFPCDGTAPCCANLVPRLAILKGLQDLPHHDARALVGGLPVADFGIGHDVFAKIDGPFHVCESYRMQGRLTSRPSRRREHGITDEMKPDALWRFAIVKMAEYSFAHHGLQFAQVLLLGGDATFTIRFVPRSREK